MLLVLVGTGLPSRFSRSGKDVAAPLLVSSRSDVTFPFNWGRPASGTSGALVMRNICGADVSQLVVAGDGGQRPWWSPRTQWQPEGVDVLCLQLHQWQSSSKALVVAKNSVATRERGCSVPSTSSSSKASATCSLQPCSLCDEVVLGNGQRHMERVHLLWYFASEWACCTCGMSCSSQCFMHAEHLQCEDHGEAWMNCYITGSYG